ncbi:chaperone modulator CbpM [Solemya velum gill symbiont]|uniref:chaperone modulator CbpM n=1 Tax=Solemya velum gill symbiont TaxID=2340 RepID=UPI000996A676|nr:chaperone modulator CbpM [Solemya velum gill symbiont]
MANMTNLHILFGELLDESTEVTLVQLCRTCAVQPDTIEAMVDQGILEPLRKQGQDLCFPATSIKRIRITLRLQRDLDVNLAGAALALELLERIDELNARLRIMKDGLEP